MVAFSWAWYNGSHTIALYPINSLELHYTNVQFLTKLWLNVIVGEIPMTRCVQKPWEGLAFSLASRNIKYPSYQGLEHPCILLQELLQSDQLVNCHNVAIGIYNVLLQNYFMTAASSNVAPPPPPQKKINK